jgi:hypothetical protein
MARRAVYPVPNAATSLPGASSSIVAMAEAVTMGWRRLGTATPVPRPIRLVASAARASATQTSVSRAGESNSQTRW